MLRRSKSHRGQGLAEYGLLIAMILGILVLVVPTIGAGYAYINSAVGSTINSAIGGGGNGGNPSSAPSGGSPSSSPSGAPTPPPNTGGNPPVITDPTPIGGNLEEVIAEGFCPNTPVSAFLDGTILLQSELTNDAWGDSVLSDDNGKVDMYVQLPSNLTAHSTHTIALSGTDCSQNPPGQFITPPDSFLIGGVYLDNLVVDTCSDNFNRTPTVNAGLGTPADCLPSTWQNQSDPAGLGQGISDFGPSNQAGYLTGKGNNPAVLNMATGYPLQISFDVWISPIGGSNRYGHWSDGEQSMQVDLGPELGSSYSYPLSLSLYLDSAFGGNLTQSVFWNANSNSLGNIDPANPSALLPGTVVNNLSSGNEGNVAVPLDCSDTLGACRFAVSIDITLSTMTIIVNGTTVNSTADFTPMTYTDGVTPTIGTQRFGVEGTSLDPYNLGWNADGTTEFGQLQFTPNWWAGTYTE